MGELYTDRGIGLGTTCAIHSIEDVRFHRIELKL